MLSGGLVLVARDIVSSQLLALGERDVAAVVTESGGRTSHAAILARSRGIPAVAGVPGILQHVKNGDTLVVDGREGHVLVNPDTETETAYRKLQREFFDLKDALAENRDQPAITADGQHVDLLANINNLADAQAATAMGAAGVGLYRTEYLFLTHPDVPDEEEQLAAYREIIAASPNRRSHDPHARPGRRQDDSLSGPRPRGQPLHGLAIDPLVVRASGVLHHADPGRCLRAAATQRRPDKRRAADVSDDHHAGRDAPRAAHGPHRHAEQLAGRRQAVWTGAASA